MSVKKSTSSNSTISIPISVSASSATVPTVSLDSNSTSSNIIDYKKLIRNWFIGLSVNERICMVALEDRPTVRLLLSMYDRKLIKGAGDGYFFAVNDDCLNQFADFSGKLKSHRHTINKSSNECSFSGNSTPAAAYELDNPYKSAANGAGTGPNTNNNNSIENSFLFRSASKLNKIYHSPPAIHAAEQQLESSIRLTDTRQYCDTLTVSTELLSNGELFLNLLDTISRGKFACYPCYVQWDSINKCWLWDVPQWFKSLGFYSLATYIANKLELVLWARYWESRRIDPRKIPSGKIYSLSGLVRERLSSKRPLEQYWLQLNKDRRDRLLYQLTSIIDSVRRNNPFISNQQDKLDSVSIASS